MHEIHCMVAGRVQMVMYRDFASRRARSLGLTGFVSNLEDGTVEMVAQGERAALEELVEHLKKGPLLARVENVDVEWREPQGLYEGFEILR